MMVIMIISFHDPSPNKGGDFYAGRVIVAGFFAEIFGESDFYAYICNRKQ
jgi:hypothetical protein